MANAGGLPTLLRERGTAERETDIGSKIQELLEKREISQKEFAKMLNIAPSTLNGYLTGRRQPDLLTIKKICLSLGISLDDMMDMPYIPQQRYNLAPEEHRILELFRSLTLEQQRLIAECGEAILPILKLHRRKHL